MVAWSPSCPASLRGSQGNISPHTTRYTPLAVQPRVLLTAKLSRSAPEYHYRTLGCAASSITHSEALAFCAEVSLPMLALTRCTHQHGRMVSFLSCIAAEEPGKHFS